MSQAWIISWDSASTNQETIASLQSATAAATMQLNPTSWPNNVLAYPNNTNPNGPYFYQQVARTVALISTMNNTAVSFTISGHGSPVDGDGNPTGLLNALISETITGPNIGAPSFSANIYTQIISITSNAAFADVSAGFGISGITQFIFPDYDRNSWYASCSAQVIDQTDLTYTGYLSLNKPTYPGFAPNAGTIVPFVGGQIPPFPIATDMTGATTNEIAQIDYPVATIWFTVSTNNIDNAGERAVFTILQQGLR
jgi:hypothetical protein